MKILIASLQVSESGSKGHLHPAIELALEAKRRGHVPYLLPLPSPLGKDDETQVQRAGIEYLTPPSLPENVIKNPDELAKLAASNDDVWKAYHSFLVAPLALQYPKVCAILEDLKPDVLIYDLLVYSAPLAARSLNLPDIGFCAGLKLIAPEIFQKTYHNVSKQLEGDLFTFLESIEQRHKFKHLELLSNHAQVVFATDLMIERSDDFPSQTHLVGPIHYSPDRGDIADSGYLRPNEKFAVLSFGSVLDPADFPEVTAAIVRATAEVGLQLIVGSRKLKTAEPHVVVEPYLPLPALLPHTSVFFHHGGANSFSEALFFAAPQILIPLTTDQPIQGFFLQKSRAGFSLSPSEVNVSNLKPLLERLLDRNDPVYARIHTLSGDYQSKRGQERVICMVEEMIASRGS
jgi:UDP:flavonoid glycosyltransferase YjiC (YdhE family)